MKVLVVGGAGFIGSHLVDGLLWEGHEVTVFDNLDFQVHGARTTPPEYLNPEAHFIHGDVRDREALLGALDDIDAVFYKAAAVGVGQSMYEIRRYVEVNSLGAANLLDIVVNEGIMLEKIVVASSMSIYGEGKYIDSAGKIYCPRVRDEAQLAKQKWDFQSPSGEVLTPLPTDENKPLYPTSVYAITKRDHEELFLSVGRAYNIPVVALRYFNVYGDRQALSNPYTGVAAIFSSRLLNGKAPLVFEDGKQTRDFVHVSDIVQANLLALCKDAANGEVFNIGTGDVVSISEVSTMIAKELGTSVTAEITQQFRAGDVRHCFADITKARTILGYEPQTNFAEGVKLLTEWVATQVSDDRVDESRAMLD